MAEDRVSIGFLIVVTILVFLLVATAIRNFEKRNEMLKFCIEQQTVTEGCKKIIDKWNP